MKRLIGGIAIVLAAAPALATEGARVECLYIDAHGRASGLLLTDGTELVTAPINGPALAATIHRGDVVPLRPSLGGALAVVDPRVGQYFTLGGTDGTAR